MGSRKDKVLMNILLGTGVYLLDSWRNRMGGTVEDLRSRAQDTYETAADRVSRASDVIRGEDSHVLGTAAAALLGLGIGMGLGLLLAPASGEETRSNIASKARDIRERVSSRAALRPARSADKNRTSDVRRRTPAFQASAFAGTLKESAVSKS